MNLPGSLLIDWTVIHTLGGGPVAWRLFDALLMLVAGAAMFIVARPYDWFAGIVAASLFWLLHARDGMGQTGQRDLMEAALLLASFAFASQVLRAPASGSRTAPHPAFPAFGPKARWTFAAAVLCASIAATIKPDSLLLSLVIAFVVLVHRQRHHRPISPLLIPAAAAFLLPVLVVLGFLLRHHAVHAFFLSLLEVTPFYASLGRQTFSELLRDCLSTPMRVFFAITILLSALNRRAWTTEKTLLALATFWGLASFFLQGKGYLYHRYPTLGFLLLWFAIECTDALRSTRLLNFIGAAGLLYASLVIAPLSLVRAARATWNSALLKSLEADLTRMGGTSLANHVQCLDSISGCNIVLYRMRLPETSGVLSDFLLFGSPDQPAVRRARSLFWEQINHHPPRVLVITGWLHPIGLDHYAKLNLWPDFATFLAARYTLTEQRDFAPGQNGPLSYRIYLLR